MKSGLKFKLGDKIITTVASIGSFYDRGWFGEVIEIDDCCVSIVEPYLVKFDNTTEWWVYEHEIELYKEQPKVADLATTTQEIPTITLTEEALKEQPLTDFGYVPNVLGSDSSIDLGVASNIDYLELYNKLSTKQYVKLEKISLKLGKISDKVGADYHQMLELLKRHF